MGYVAVKGGRQAIETAGAFFHYQKAQGDSAPLALDQIQEQLHLAVDRIMGEGGLYAPRLAALAFKQAGGDTFGAAFMMRAYRTTQPRIGYSIPQSTASMRVIRRISAAFKEIPGGQVLGPTSDYTLRLLDFELAEPGSDVQAERVRDLLADLPEAKPLPDSFPKVVEILRREGLLIERGTGAGANEPVQDVTRQSLSLPAARSATLQQMAMGETGGLLALAYSNMRGFGVVHPYVGELRVGYLPVCIQNPYTETPEVVGEVKATEAEIISKMDTGGGRPQFRIGYGLCFGHNETKAISMGVLDRAMQTEEPQSPSEDQEFVLLHVDGIEAMGFCNHFKLPHYVTFQSELDRLRKAQEKA